MAILLETQKAQKARQLFCEGYNCAQAVFGAFAEETGMDWETAMLLTSSMGGGVARMREVCGAVSGMALAAGLLWGYSSPTAQEEKKPHYAGVQKLCGQFIAENGSIVCHQLLEGVLVTAGGVPEQRSESYYKKRPCGELVACAAAILEQELENRGYKK